MLRNAGVRIDARGSAVLPGRDELAHAVGQRRGRVVGGQGLAGRCKVEHPFGVDAAALELIEVLGELSGVFVAPAHVLDDPGLPGLEGITVAGVDRPGEASVRTLAGSPPTDDHEAAY